MSKWGNSLAVRLPQAVVEALGSRRVTNEVTIAGTRTSRFPATAGVRKR
jgi:antitoxin component of MazEF toxin-antitoxin module